MGLIGLIVYPTINKVINENREKLYNQQVEEIERISKTWAVSNMKLLPTVNNKNYYLELSELYDSGFMKQDTIYNPKTNERMTGCVIITWKENIKQHTYTYDEECTRLELPEIVLNVNDGTINSNGWANNDFYVNVSGNYLESYSYCVSNSECTPNTNVAGSTGSVYVTTEGSNYVCVKGINSTGETETLCKQYNLNKQGVIIGDIVFTGTKGENDWYTSDVTVSYTDSSSISGIKSVNFSPNKLNVSEETQGIEYTLTVTDNAGNVKTVTKTLKIDKTAPEVGTPIFTGTKGSNNWYTSNVTVGVSNGSDSISGHASTVSNITSITENTAGTTITITTKDNAGNSASQDYVVKVDKSSPTFVNASIYYDLYGSINDYITPTYGVSGKTSLSCNKNIDDLVIGTNKVNCTATSNNGKTTTTELTFITNMLKAATYANNSSENWLGSLIKRNQIKSVYIVDNKNIPSGATSWDVSARGNGSVMAWYNDSDENGLYELYIGQDGGVIASSGSYLFQCFDKITTLDVSNLDTSIVTDMTRMFGRNSAITLKFGGKFDTSNVEKMGFMFYASKATNLDLSNFNTKNVTIMSEMFLNSQAETITFSPSFDTSKVTTMMRMFDGTNAKELNLEYFNTSSVKSMYGMFQNNLATSLDLSSFDTSKVTDMYSMFSRSQATTITGLNKFNTSNVTNMGFMFYSSKLTTLDLSSFDTSKVTSMSGMFQNSKATTGYAKTRADADKFNASSNKPSALTFTVKWSGIGSGSL